MSNMSVKQLESKLSQIRRCFYISQFILIGGFFIAITIGFISNAYINEATSITVFFLILIASYIAQAFYDGEYLISKCPNCNAYLYSLFKWPFMGWIMFIFFSNCKKCGLNLHGKNINKYATQTPKKRLRRQ